MFSRSAALARPVRSVEKSAFIFSRVLCICAWIWLMIGAGIMVAPLVALDQSSDRFSGYDSPDISRLVKIENDDRQIIFHAKGKGRGVHNPKSFAYCFHGRKNR